MILAWLMIFSAFLETPAVLKDGKCSACRKWHVESTVTMERNGGCTAMACAPGHYDEKGSYHPAEPCNTCTTVGMCSRGHEVYFTWKQ